MVNHNRRHKSALSNPLVYRLSNSAHAASASSWSLVFGNLPRKVAPLCNCLASFLLASAVYASSLLLLLLVLLVAGPGCACCAHGIIIIGIIEGPGADVRGFLRPPPHH